MPKRRTSLVVSCAIALSVAMITGCINVSDDSDAGRYQRIEERYASLEQMLPGVRDASVSELAEMIEREPTVFVDVRAAEEHAVSIIPGAVTKEWFEQHRDRVRGRPVVTCCTTGARSGH